MAALVDDAAGIAENDQFRRHADRLGQFGAGDARRAGAVDHHADFRNRPPGQVQGVQKTGDGDDGGAVLVVVKHRDIELLLEPLLDDETLWRFDILQIDAAERRPEKAHAIDELVHVLGVDLQVEAVDVGKALE